jgi:CheY-like chemotaxis protein
LVLPWQSAPRLRVEPTMTQTMAHAPIQAPVQGSLALIDEGEPQPTPRPAPGHRSILLAADDPQVARAIRTELELAGDPTWSVVIASDGKRALELAAAAPPQLALLDVSLSDTGGVAIYRYLRANPATRGTPALFLSTATAPDLYHLGIHDGVLLRKPFDLCDLVSLVRALVTPPTA